MCDMAGCRFQASRDICSAVPTSIWRSTDGTHGSEEPKSCFKSCQEFEEPCYGLGARRSPQERPLVLQVDGKGSSPRSWKKVPSQGMGVSGGGQRRVEPRREKERRSVFVRTVWPWVGFTVRLSRVNNEKKHRSW